MARYLEKLFLAEKLIEDANPVIKEVASSNESTKLVTQYALFDLTNGLLFCLKLSIIMILI